MVRGYLTILARNGDIFHLRFPGVPIRLAVKAREQHRFFASETVPGEALADNLRHCQLE